MKLKDDKTNRAELFIEYADMDDITLRALCNIFHIKTSDRTKAIEQLIKELVFIDDLHELMEGK